MILNNIRIVICSGGTGGHLFPSKAVIENLLLKTCELNNRNSYNVKNLYSVDFFTDKRSLAFLDDINKNVNIKTIYTLQFSGKSSVLKIKSLLFISVGFLQSLRSFIFRRPQVVVAFGGYVSVPVLAAAVILRIPILIHEQNAILGRANRLFVRFATVVATSFEITLGLDKYSNKVKFTGLPIRKELVNAVRLSSYLLSNHFTISILGGSQGANILGTFIPKAFALLPLDIQYKLFIYHQCRKELLKDVLVEWYKVKSQVIVKSFFTNIGHIFSCSDLVISRSGASTIAEVNAFGKPALYIPLKKSILNHQLLNAQAMVDKGAAKVILEDDLSFSKFNDIIIKLLTNKSEMYNMGVFAKKACNLDAVNYLTSIIINLAISKHAKL